MFVYSVGQQVLESVTPRGFHGAYTQDTDSARHVTPIENTRKKNATKMFNVYVDLKKPFQLRRRLCLKCCVGVWGISLSSAMR